MFGKITLMEDIWDSSNLAEKMVHVEKVRIIMKN